MHTTLLVEAGDGLRSDLLSAGCADLLEGDPLDRADIALDQVATVVHLANYSVGLVLVEQRDRGGAPLLRRRLLDGSVCEHVAMPIGPEPGNHDAGACPRGIGAHRRVDGHDDPD